VSSITSASAALQFRSPLAPKGQKIAVPPSRGNSSGVVVAVGKSSISSAPTTSVLRPSLSRRLLVLGATDNEFVNPMGRSGGKGGGLGQAKPPKMSAAPTCVSSKSDGQVDDVVNPLMADEVRYKQVFKPSIARKQSLYLD
jgi:hypothetical protein